MLVIHSDDMDLHSNFTRFASPAHTSMFSGSYFDNLSLRSAGELEYPIILPSNSVISYQFYLDEVWSASSTLVLPGEHIPCLEDLKPILAEREAAFEHGMRSVSVIINGDAKVYHLSKVCLIDKFLAMPVH